MIGAMKSRRIRRVEPDACTERRRNARSILVGKPDGDPMKQQGVGGKIILKWALKK